MNIQFFSKDYAEARSRFVELAGKVGAQTFSYPIAGAPDENLTIDVATIGPMDAPALVISSGVHGVEAFFGSAVQLAFLNEMAARNPSTSVRYVFLHVINPYGFAHLRRCNEDSVDLNRNFLIPPAEYRGAPKDYESLNGFLNPASDASPGELFLPQAAWAVLRFGMQRVKQAVAGGQYDFPRGLFFGGKEPCQSTRCVMDHCDKWLGDSARVIHVDFHTGLGKYAAYRLLLRDDETPESVAWYAQTFGAEAVEAGTVSHRTAYRVSGGFGEWMQHHFRSREYRFVAAEFGTYHSIQMLRVLRAENRAHHYGTSGSRQFQIVKSQFADCFCPQDPRWREQVVQSGLKIIHQANDSLARG